MKKIISAFLFLCIACGLFAQEKMTSNPFIKPETESSYCAKKTTQDDSEITITWLTDDARATAYGNASSSTGVTMAAFMQFDQTDIFNFNSTSKKLNTITQVQFYIDTLLNVNTCYVLLMQGADLATATEVVKQAVDKVTLVKGWNTVNLQTPYAVDPSQNLFIGFQLVTSGPSYPFGAASGTNAKQAWVKVNSTVSSIVNNKHVFLIKAIATTETSPTAEIMLTTLNVPSYKMQGDSIAVSGQVKNMGTAPLTSFKLVYEVDGVKSTEMEITGLNVITNGTATFTHTQKIPCSTPNMVNYKITVSKPNGIEDVVSNNTLSASVPVYASLVQRIVLHEVFTSSTCGPCKTGNEKLTAVLKATDTTKWACIKYQYNFPGTGDPYYTAECETRATFYGGVSGVPTLNGDGKSLVINPSSYTASQFNTLAQVPAAVKLLGTANIDDKTVSLHVTVDPISNIINPNLRFFAAIVEKTTVKNVKSNKETSFEYVMKKFMTNANGNKIDSLQIGTTKTLDYSYTFNGTYRLPADANNPINHATEHSVEGFNDLLVVYWIQDISTKMIYQAGRAVDPDPHGSSETSITSVSNEINFNVFPNPATNQFTIQSSVPFTKITLVNSIGQVVKNIQTSTTEYQIGTEGLPKGMYLLRVETQRGVSTQKVQIQ